MRIIPFNYMKNNNVTAPLLPPILTNLWINANGSSYNGTTISPNYYWMGINGTNFDIYAYTVRDYFSTDNGGYFYFDGTKQLVYSYADDSLGSQTVSKTFGGWFKTRRSGENQLLLRGGLQSGDPYATAVNLRLKQDTNNKASFTITFNNDSTNTIVSTTSIYNDWYYITARWQAGVGISLFVNGVLESSALNSYSELKASIFSYAIAGGTVNLPGDVKGEFNIGEFIVYEGALSDADILYNFNARKSLYGY